MDSGWKCLMLAMAMHKVQADEGALRHEFGGGELSKVDMVQAIKKAGFRSRLVRADWKRLGTLPLPAICSLRAGGFALLCAVRPPKEKDGKQKALVLLPSAPEPQAIPAEKLREMSDGDVIMLTPRAPSESHVRGKFGFAWFLPSIIKYRKHFGEVLAVSLVIQLLALLTPLFFQVVLVNLPRLL